MFKQSTVRTPYRIDLSGGTLDIWPLYLLFGGLKLNQMAIDLYAQAESSFDSSKKTSIKIISKDLDKTAVFKSVKELEDSLKKTPKAFPLRWLARIAHHHVSQVKNFKGSLSLETVSEIPPGSGLGGSSVLGVAVSKSLENVLKAKSKHLSTWDFHSELKNLESVEIEFPAGEQDYVPAMLGGLLSFQMEAGSKKAVPHSKSVANKLSKHLALIYTGKPHHSGANNWDVFKAVFEKDKKVMSSLSKISDLSKKISADLSKGSLQDFAKDLNKEWQLRLKLTDKFNAPVLSEAWNFAKKNGAIARKACGSGGGGCMMFYFKNPQDIKRLSSTQMPSDDWKFIPVKTSFAKLF